MQFRNCRTQLSQPESQYVLYKHVCKNCPIDFKLGIMNYGNLETSLAAIKFNNKKSLCS